MTTLETIRKRLKLTQAGMAELLDLSLRAYQDIESGASKERQAYIDAAEHHAMQRAVLFGEPAMATEGAIEYARALVNLVDGPSSDPTPIDRGAKLAEVVSLIGDFKAASEARAAALAAIRQFKSEVVDTMPMTVHYAPFRMMVNNALAEAEKPQ